MNEKALFGDATTPRLILDVDHVVLNAARMRALRNLARDAASSRQDIQVA